MDQEKLQYYREHPEIFLKEIYNIELLDYQIEFLKTILKEPKEKWYIRWSRGCDKRQFHRALAYVLKDLN